MTIQTLDSASDLVVLSPASSAVGSIVQWAGNLTTAAQAMQRIVDTPFMPLSFWPLPKGMSLRDWPTPHLKHPRESDEEFIARRDVAIASGAIAVVKGDELGLTPQAALESIYVVRGKPGMYAEAMEALVKAHGHQVQLVELTDRICRMRGRRRGETDWQHFEFTIERARRAGYTKQNPKYESDPQSMLHPRCRALTSLGIAPDTLKGLASIEEIEDEARVTVDGGQGRTRAVKRAAPAPVLERASGGHTQGAPTTPPRPASAAPAEAPTPAPVAAGLPPLPGEEPAPEPEQPATEAAIDERTWSQINARFVEIGRAVKGFTGTGQSSNRLTVISHIVGRTIGQGRDLTAVEGQQILDNLAGDAGVTLARDVLHGPAAEPVEEGGGGQAAVLETSDVAEEELPDPSDGTDPWAGIEAGAE